MSADAVEFRTIRTNGVRLHAAAAGPEDGPLLVLSHERMSDAPSAFFGGGGTGRART